MSTKPQKKKGKPAKVEYSNNVLPKPTAIVDEKKPQDKKTEKTKPHWTVYTGIASIIISGASFITPIYITANQTQFWIMLDSRISA